MGFSERPDAPRTLAQRVADLGGLTDALGVTGPVVTVGHDWGGVDLAGLGAGPPRRSCAASSLGNTAVAQPPGDRGPPLIRLAHLPGRARRSAAWRTPVFVRATSALSRPALPPTYATPSPLPYATAHRRRAVGDFVADIPFAAGHPSHPTVEAIAEGVRTLDVPALMFWGPRDPVFGERYLADLRDRLPQARLHRFEGASHLVTEDAPQYADASRSWLADLDEPPTPAPDGHARATRSRVRNRRPLWSALDQRAERHRPRSSSTCGGATVSWAALVPAGTRARGRAWPPPGSGRATGSACWSSPPPT